MKSLGGAPLRVPPGSHPARGAWIEIPSQRPGIRGRGSHPARGAWIEIRAIATAPGAGYVAPRKGCVD